ncbi:MAG TPA: hypothetical protein VIV58_15675, partial [Kofleriaceae bacterium]
MPTLLQYLAALANDPSAQQAFGDDPEGALAKSGLSDQDQAVLRTRNAGLIQAIAGQQAAAALIYKATDPTQLIYAMAPQPQPQLIYGVGPTQLIYATAPQPQPQLIYGVGATQLIYAAQPQPHPQLIYGVGAPQSVGASAPALI